MSQMTRRALLSGAACTLATPALARFVSAADISRIQVRKAQRKLDLIGAGRIIKTYDVRLGGNPIGHKRFRGDNRTPEGGYRIDRRNPQSSFHLSLGVSYPNNADRAYARSRGMSPGGDIFIHGQPNGSRGTLAYDWTRGCIAVSNSDMGELWKLIRIGCPITIHK